MQLQRVVVGVDFSDASCACARWTVHHFARGARITLVHVLGGAPAAPGAPAEAAHELAEHRCSEVRSGLPAQDVEIEIVDGPIPDGIARVAQRTGSLGRKSGRCRLRNRRALLRCTLTAKRDESAGSGTAERWEDDAEVEAFDAEEPSSRYFTHLWEESPETLDVEWDDVTSDGRGEVHEYTVADLMSRDVKSLPPLTEVAAAADFMNAAGIHRVLVMTDSHLDGIVSSMDIVDAVAKHEIPPPQIVYSREREFESDWSHEPVVPDVNDRA